jgi:hypothetical protein
VKSGEDFYFIQKLVKNGKVGLWCNAIAHPSSRFSSRVLFGTGPALIKGAAGDWNSYPVYEKISYDNVRLTFESFPALFTKNLHTPMDAFLKQQFREVDIWGPLRRNFKDRHNFIKACQGKVDGLRILQYLRKSKTTTMDEDAKILRKFIDSELADFIDARQTLDLNTFDFDESPIATLEEVRNVLFELEQKMRKEKDQKLDF